MWCKARDVRGGYDLPVECGLSVLAAGAMGAKNNLVSMKKALSTASAYHAP